MAAFIIFGVLAAFGALAVLWALFGFLLPGHRGLAMVYLCRGREEAVVRRYIWLRDLGLLHGPLILVDCALPEEERLCLIGNRHGVEFCDLEALSARLEQERKNVG